MIETIIQIAVDQLNATKSSSSLDVLTVTSSFLSDRAHTPEVTTLLIWNCLNTLLFPWCPLSLFEQHFTQFLPSLIRLVTATVTLSYENDDSTWVGHRRLHPLHTSIFHLLKLIKSLDQLVWDTNPSISSLGTQLAFLLTRSDPASHWSSSDGWNPSQLVPILKQRERVPITTSNASRLTTQKYDKTRQLLTSFQEEGLEDRCEQVDPQAPPDRFMQTMSTLSILGSNSLKPPPRHHP
ncbi:hypothetical protein BLNAU_13862 [Blattamonas nauphoetae]|uniref:Uncharacterized protein n=1 Tax=Blattamonas nauphoetae TaxID=2049346 RepID=A0ABQ9XFJ7_9EUKA|nr:hypothetical protein BLNAU_13862 [Blattamonas nauphoetae]